MSVLEKINYPEMDLPTIGSTQTTNCQKELTQNQIDILLAEARWNIFNLDEECL